MPSLLVCLQALMLPDLLNFLWVFVGAAVMLAALLTCAFGAGVAQVASMGLALARVMQYLVTGNDGGVMRVSACMHRGGHAAR